MVGARRRRDRDARRARPLERRLAQIHARVCELIDEHQPEAVAVEDLYFGANARTAFAVGQARGVVLLAAGQRGIPCCSYTPQEVKQAVCGTGRADKDQVQRMVQTLLVARGAAASPTTRPTRSRSRSATPTARRCARAGARRSHDRAPVRARSRSAAPTTSSSSAAASATGSRSRRETLRQRPRAWASRRTLHTHLVVRDDALQLYGFATEEERELFLLLIGVQGGRARRWRSPCSPAARRASC